MFKSFKDWYDISFRQMKRYRNRVEVDKEVYSTAKGRWIIDRIPDVHTTEFKVLELCCGKCFLPVFLKKTKGLKFDYIGVDKKKYNVAFGQKLIETHNHRSVSLASTVVLYGDIDKKFPWPEMFDQVWMLGVYVRGFTSDYDHVLDEVYRVLKPGGFFMFDVPWTDTRKKYDGRRVDEDSMVKLLEKHGFSAVNIDILERPGYEQIPDGDIMFTRDTYDYLGVMAKKEVDI